MNIFEIIIEGNASVPTTEKQLPLAINERSVTSPSITSPSITTTSSSSELGAEYLARVYGPGNVPTDLLTMMEIIKTVSNGTTDSGLLNFLVRINNLPHDHAQRLGSLFNRIKASEINLNTSSNQSSSPAITNSNQEQLVDFSSITVPKIDKIDPIKVPSLEEIQSLQIGSEIELSIPCAENSRYKPKRAEDASVNFGEGSIYLDDLNKEKETDWLATYGVQWTADQKFRDLYQNFLDGHSGTIEGIKIRVKRTEKDKYLVRIEGDGEYGVEKAIKGGDSLSQEDPDAAGKHGEGLKMVALQMLRDDNVSKVTYSSRNWKIDYTLGKFSTGSIGLKRYLSQVDDRNGNFVEIQVKDDDSQFVHNLMESINLVYYPQHPDFSNPSYETKYGGFKILGLEDDGSFYQAGQRYATSRAGKVQWSGGFKGISVWKRREEEGFARERPPVKIDEALASKPVQVLQVLMRFDSLDEMLSMSKEECLRFLKETEPFWSDIYNDRFYERPNRKDKLKPEYKLLEYFVSFLCFRLKELGVKIKFPDQYIASKDPFLIKDLSLAIPDLKPCHRLLEEVGMRKDSAMSKKLKELISCEASNIEKFKLKLLLEAVSVFASKSDIFKVYPDFKSVDISVCKTLAKAERDEFALFENNQLRINRDIFTCSFNDALGSLITAIDHKYRQHQGLLELSPEKFITDFCRGNNERRRLFDLAQLWEHTTSLDLQN